MADTITRTQQTLSNLVLMSAAELAEFYWATAENYAEEEDREVKFRGTKLLNAIDAIGEVNFPDDWWEIKAAA